MVVGGSIEHQNNYVTANRFYVEIENTLTAAFSECSSFGVKIDYDTIHEAGVNDQQRILLKQPTFSEVTLKRGISNNLIFWDWINRILTNQPNSRRDINIVLFNQAGETIQVWTLIGAVPVGWTAPALQAEGADVAIEELILAYEGLAINRSGGGGALYLTGGRDGTGYFP